MHAKPQRGGVVLRKPSPGPDNWRPLTTVVLVSSKGHIVKRFYAMRKPSTSETLPPTYVPSSLTVLSVSPTEEDHLSLQVIIGHKCVLFKADDLDSAMTLLRQHQIGVVLCERDLAAGNWTELLEHIKDLRNGPSLIVTSRLADERLWSEALNVGAWDVLAKPFDRVEVARTVQSAWHRWQNEIQTSARGMKAVAAA